MTYYSFIVRVGLKTIVDGWMSGAPRDQSNSKFITYSVFIEASVFLLYLLMFPICNRAYSKYCK